MRDSNNVLVNVGSLQRALDMSTRSTLSAMDGI